VTLPDRVFVIVVESAAGRASERMPILAAADPAEGRIAPVFSSMQRAAAFLARAQELGFYVQLDYIFPVDGGRFAEDFPGHEPRLDPSPEAFFGSGAEA
jgi:hypothetical protein